MLAVLGWVLVELRCGPVVVVAVVVVVVGLWWVLWWGPGCDLYWCWPGVLVDCRSGVFLLPCYLHLHLSQLLTYLFVQIVE